MLECYLDDAGTHDSSKVIVWAGVAGDHHFFDELEALWKARLQNPFDNKPPIKAFHSWDLSAGTGEFTGYNQAERDATRLNFRKIITDLKLTFITNGISVNAWKKFATPHPLGKVCTAESFIFSYIVKYVCHSAKEHGDPISFQFDKGRLSPEIISSIKPGLDAADIGDLHVSYGFSSVKLNAGLQAADLVAHETCRYYKQFLENPNAKPDAHLQRLIEGVYDYGDGWFGHDQVRDFFEKVGADVNLMNLLDDPSAET
jgi:hypothetical protein